MNCKIAVIFLLSLAACGELDKLGQDPSTGNSTGGTTGGQPNDPSGCANCTGPTTRFIGRVIPTAPGGTLMAWSATTAVTRFYGTSIRINMTNQTSGQANRMDVVLDGTTLAEPIVVKDGVTSYTVNANGEGPHNLWVVKRTEAGNGAVLFSGFEPDGEPLLGTPAAPERNIEFIGDSISAGYGIEAPDVDCPSLPKSLVADPDFENAWKAYGPLTAVALKADWSVIAWSGNGVATSRTGDTNATLPKIWPLVDPTDPQSGYSFDKQPQVVVVNLGTNDFSVVDRSQGKVTKNPDKATFTAAYLAFVKNIRSKYPQAQIILCLGPMLSNFSPSGSLMQLDTARSYIESVIAAAADKKVTFFEFPVNQTEYGCEYHPNAAHQKKMASLLTAQIQKITGWK